MMLFKLFGKFIDWLFNRKPFGEFTEDIIFIEKLLNHYKALLGEQLYNDFAIQLKSIKEKQQDKLFNISVVGDFNTGKSTFINALLRNNLLDSSAEQSTTTSSITLEHSKKYGLIVTQKNAGDEAKEFDSLDSLRAGLSTYGANIEKSQNIERIRVTLPSKTLKKKKFRIIDTPGLGATDSWLKDITKDVIERISDTSVLVVNANKILPGDYCNFIKTNLKKVLSRCVFLVTFFDQIRDKEKERTLKYIKNKIKTEFEIEEPLILPYVSIEVLKDCKLEEGKVNKDYLKLSVENENKLLEYVENKRQEIQTNKLIEMVQKLYDTIEEHVKNIQGNFEQELDILKRTRQANLELFVEKQIELRTKAYNDNINVGFDFYKEDCNKKIRKCVLEVLRDFDSYIPKDFSELEQWCKNTCTLNVNRLRSKMYSDLYVSERRFSDEAHEQIKIFQSNFEDYFKELKLLKFVFTSNSNLNSLNVNSNELDSTLSKVQEIKSGEQFATAVVGMFGASGGAFVGALLGGPIGFLLGGFAGSFLGRIGGFNAENEKKKIRPELETNLSHIFTDYADSLVEKYETQIENGKRQVEAEIRRYLKIYKEAVERKIQEQESKRKEIMSQIKLLNADLLRIEMHKKKLIAIGKQKITEME